MPDHLYRNGIGIILINSNKKIFVGKRIDNQSDAWQMPQGGIDVGEDEDLAMYRELLEETGIKSENVKLIKKSNRYFYYNLPYKLQKKFWGGKYLGQKQRWYLVRFVGTDQDVNISSHEPEFSEWKWVNSDDLLNLIVSFKRKLYQELITEFSEFL
ncbi:MAG: RNA pyrophosphohydrolase [Proteobacteria bacterium]|nr:RNA pyrophosphohydrolase [Pseudomonadota bacterium]NCA28394.1 RNA pyrophosphohydrolase [Pseudomonadota bacterium]